MSKRSTWSFLVLVLSMLSFGAHAQSFFKPVVKPSVRILSDANADVVSMKAWRPIGTLPSMKISRQDEALGATVLTSIGGGISYQYLEYIDDNWKANFMIAPLTLLSSSAETGLDVSLLSYVGFNDNRFMLGVGKELTSAKQWFAALTYGISFN